MKQIPQGVDDFDLIMEEDYYYIDKSMYIPTLESQAPFILFVRPRRMGKSLFVNMLMSYYDINKSELFDKLFGELWIGKNKTKYANKFLVLKFDFSQVSGTGEELVNNFNKYCFSQIRLFFKRYQEYFLEEDIQYTLSTNNVGLAINYFVGIAKLKNLPVYLFLDEYDNFCNTIIATQEGHTHEEIARGEIFYHDFFQSCKGTFQRVFMTGTVPVVYGELSSYYNIADVVSLEPRFDKMLGVCETELRDMIMYYRSHGKIFQDADEIIAEMKRWYGNLCFAEECYGDGASIYNTNSVMRYIGSLITDGSSLKPMMDYCARIVHTKLNFLVMAEDLDNRERRIEIVKEICAKSYITGTVKEQFSAGSCGDEQNFKSMLYYFGTLSYGGYDENGVTKLIVPNRNMGELYLQYMVRMVEIPVLDSAKERRLLDITIQEAALHHDWQPMIDKIGQMYPKYSSIRNIGESDIQGFMRGFICLNDHFAIWPELELNKGFCDVLLVPRENPQCLTKYSYLIEIKYMKQEEKNVDKYVSQACNQLERYVSENRLTNSPLLRGTTLTLLYVVFQGTKLLASGVYDGKAK